MMIKVWIYGVAGNGREHLFVAINENDTVSMPEIDENGDGHRREMRHHLLPAWCIENGYMCRVVVKEIEI